MKTYYEKRSVAEDGLPKETGMYLTNAGMVFLNSNWEKADGIKWYFEFEQKKQREDFVRWVDKWYAYYKGGWRHRGDFYNNSKLTKSDDLYHIFLSHQQTLKK